ncbi:MAG: hypothetical protein IRZ31_20145 [Thermogemmatispora sp.]|uniref:hypothetical protein n=1 Tax=Thermogemmatispora sp. TaxID=1968838 RepID=UPI00262EB0A4|nr:hypothetical protein [Thermogemmatispora sp.]MBX5459211.1 hypothetical protein [Thermogemmatispora sp.]
MLYFYGRMGLRRQREHGIHSFTVSVLMLVLLALCWLLGHALALSPTIASRLLPSLLPGGLTGLWLLSFGWQIVQAPAALWDLPDLEWWLTAPVPLVFVLIRASLRLLATLRSIGIILLALAMLALAALHLSPLLIPLLGLLFLYGALSSTLLALLLTLWLASYFGKHRLRQLIIFLAASSCCLPLGLLLIPLLPTGGENLRALLLSTGVLWPGTILTDLILAPIGSATDRSPAPLPLSTSLAILAVMLGCLLLLGGACVLVGKRGYLAGWEGSLIAPERETQHRSVRRSSLRGGVLWELAWHVRLGPPAVSALIGFCWQDTLYDWRRLPSIVISAFLLLAACWHITLSGPLALPLMLALILSFDALVARTVGLPALRRLLQAQPLLQTTPTTAAILLWSCTLAVGLPMLLVNDLLFALTLALMPLTPTLAALFWLCLTGGGIGFSVLSVTAGCVTMNTASVRGSQRASAVIFLMGGLGLALSTLLPLSAAALLDLDLATRHLVLTLLQSMLHLSLSLWLQRLLFWGLPSATIALLVSLTLRSAKRVHEFLGPVP